MNPLHVPPEEAPAHLSWSALSHVGKVRKNNEDSFVGLVFDSQTYHYLGKQGELSLVDGDVVFAVGDGMGGAHAGEFASKIAIEKIVKWLPKGFRSMASGMEAGFVDLYSELFHDIHKALSYLGSQYTECEGMGSTLSICWFAPGWMFFAHIGDSRIYYLPKSGGMRQLSNDDTHVGWLLRNKRINEREARSHPLKNSINKALGAGHQFVEPQVGSVACQKGDLFLICSDGVVDGLWDRQIHQLLREPEVHETQIPWAQRLVDASLDRSGRDNTTAVVVEAR